MEAAKLPRPLPLEPIFGDRLPLGTMLVQKGVLTPEQLEAALSEREETNQRLGEILVARQWLTRTQLAQALADLPRGPLVRA